MDATEARNKSSQTLGIIGKGGRKIILYPGKAFSLSAEELRSPQVQSLLQSGLVNLEKTGKKPSKHSTHAIAAKHEKMEVEKHSDKKRG
jgi:hypothetical protein